MVDFIGFLQYGLDKSYAIYAQIYQIHDGETETLPTEGTVHQKHRCDQEENVGNEHWWVW
jgi:hypothetical protein